MDRRRYADELSAASAMRCARRSQRCRICLDGSEVDELLFRPCRCASPCHPSCLQTWRHRGIGNSNEVLNQCEVCHARYRTEIARVPSIADYIKTLVWCPRQSLAGCARRMGLVVLSVAIAGVALAAASGLVALFVAHLLSEFNLFLAVSILSSALHADLRTRMLIQVAVPILGFLLSFALRCWSTSFSSRCFADWAASLHVHRTLPPAPNHAPWPPSPLFFFGWGGRSWTDWLVSLLVAGLMACAVMLYVEFATFKRRFQVDRVLPFSDAATASPYSYSAARLD